MWSSSLRYFICITLTTTQNFLKFSSPFSQPASWNLNLLVRFAICFVGSLWWLLDPKLCVFHTKSSCMHDCSLGFLSNVLIVSFGHVSYFQCFKENTLRNTNGSWLWIHKIKIVNPSRLQKFLKKLVQMIILKW